MILFIKNSYANSQFNENGKYNCKNIEAYLMNENFTKKLQVIGVDSYPLEFDFSKNAISNPYGPSGFKKSTNYFGNWKKFEGYDMFTVESSDPKSPLNWDMVLIGAKNNPITARKVKQGYRTFKYQCSPY